MAPFFTIGHSTRTIPEFVDLLRAGEVEVVVDVRTVPRSRTNPQFNQERLPESLAAEAIGYRHAAALGGLRGRRKDAEPSPNLLWENASFRNYADYAMTPAFQSALGELRALGAERRCAIMCAEAVWWRCHRRIIADYLIDAGERVVHILGPGHMASARLTPGAHATSQGTGAPDILVYPRPGPELDPPR